MIFQRLQDLHDKASDALGKTGLMQVVQGGQVTVGHYVTFLADVLAYTRHRPAVIGRAASRLVRSHPLLADYLFRRGLEELARDRLIESDLKDLGVPSGEIETLQPSHSCVRLMELEQLYASQENPAALVGWMFVLTSLGDRPGDDLAEKLDRTLQLNGRAQKFLRGYTGAEIHHSEALDRALFGSVLSPADEQAILREASESLTLYCGMWDAATSGQVTRVA